MVLDSTCQFAGGTPSMPPSMNGAAIAPNATDSFPEPEPEPEPDPGSIVTSVATMVPLGSVVHVPVNESELVPMVTVVFLIVPSEPRVSVLLKLSLGDSTDELSLESDPELLPLDAPLLAIDESMLDCPELPPEPDPPGPLPPGPEPPGPLPPPEDPPPPDDPPPDEPESSVEAIEDWIEEPPDDPPLEAAEEPPLEASVDPPPVLELSGAVSLTPGESDSLGGVPLSLVNASVV